MKITTQKSGGIWHGYLEGHPEVDERGLTEEVVRRKVERIVARLEEETTAACFSPPPSETRTLEGETRARPKSRGRL